MKPKISRAPGSGRTSPSLGRNPKQKPSRLYAVLSHAGLHRLTTHRWTTGQRLEVPVQLVENRRQPVLETYRREVISAPQLRLRSPQPASECQRPTSESPRGHPRLPIRRILHLLRNPVRRPRLLRILPELTPHQQRQNHRLHSVPKVRHQLVRQHRERRILPRRPPALKPRHRNQTVACRPQLTRLPVVRGDLPEPALPPANRTHPSRCRTPVDLFVVKRFFVLPNGAEAVRI